MSPCMMAACLGLRGDQAEDIGWQERQAVGPRRPIVYKRSVSNVERIIGKTLLNGW